jgi:hypothetical protein
MAMCFVPPLLAQDRTLFIPIFKSAPNGGVSAIPFYCSESITSPGDLEVPNCFRSDTRQSIIPVPDGHFLLLTDISVTPNSTGTTGRAFVWIGRNDGVSLPSEPRFDLYLDELSRSYQFQWSIPQVILRPGEEIGVYSSASSDRTVDFRMSGYLVEADGFGG